MEFYQTTYAKRLFEAQLPALINSLNKLADIKEIELRKPESKTKIVSINNLKTSEKAKKQLRDVIINANECEKFAAKLLEQIAADDEALHRKGYYIAKAILDDSVEDLLIAICGWGSESLLNIADCKKNNIEE